MRNFLDINKKEKLLFKKLNERTETVKQRAEKEREAEQAEISKSRAS